jgi:cytochrome c biogenesis protein CcmG, thiol:disulfide interchange protein DsbE
MPSETMRGETQGPAAAGRVSAHRRRLLQALAACAAGGIGVWPGLCRADGPRVGRPAPPLTLRTLDGQTLSTDSLRGKVVILSFWATWCGPCKEELPLLSDYAARHAAQGLQVLGFSLDDPADLAAVRKAAAGLSFPVGLLGGSYAGDYGRIWKLPANFTIDRGGVLVDNSWDADVPQWTAERLERVVTPLLSPPAPKPDKA